MDQRSGTEISGTASGIRREVGEPPELKRNGLTRLSTNFKEGEIRAFIDDEIVDGDGAIIVFRIDEIFGTVVIKESAGAVIDDGDVGGYRGSAIGGRRELEGFGPIKVNVLLALNANANLERGVALSNDRRVGAVVSDP